MRTGPFPMGEASIPPARSERFPRSVRLTRRREFSQVFARGHRIGGRHVVIYLLPNEGPTSRLGVTVPRQVGDAPARNRVRRRLREIFRRRLRSVLDETCRPADVVVRVLPGAAEATLSELEAAFLEAAACWQRRGTPARERRS